MISSNWTTYNQWTTYKIGQRERDETKINRTTYKQWMTYKTVKIDQDELIDNQSDNL